MTRGSEASGKRAESEDPRISALDLLGAEL